MAGFSWTIGSGSGSGTTGTTGGGFADTAEGRNDRRTLGTDLLFDGDYAVGQDGDYILLSGLENLRQAVYRRLLTKPGEYKFVPEYGVGIQLWVKRKRTPAILKQLESAIRENLLREKRIERIVDIAIQNIEGGVQINIAVKASGRFLRFSPFLFSEDV